MSEIHKLQMYIHQTHQVHKSQIYEFLQTKLCIKLKFKISKFSQTSHSNLSLCVRQREILLKETVWKFCCSHTVRSCDFLSARV